MCGIAGVLNLGGQPVDRGLLLGMIGRVSHRGPDALGMYSSGGIGLAHSRLSIIDLVGGRQPMSNEDGSVWISFNGEIFNYLEVRNALAAKGHQFRTRSDTEVVIHAYEEYGEECVHRLNGQWAFVLWDATRQKLFVSRDRFGILPLFYARTATGLIFASEIKSLFADGGVERRIDLEGLAQSFTLWCTVAPRTPFDGVQELPPGHNLVVERGAVRVQRYWRLSYGPQPPEVDEARCLDELRSLLLDATRLRLRSDVPVGVYLSGGLDSTIIAALTARVASASPRTFSVAFDDTEFDESFFQQEAARFLDADHEALACVADDICRVFPEVVWHAERPLTRTAPAPLFILSDLVRRSGRKVILTGEGADEIFGGYDIFKEAKVRRFLGAKPQSRRRPILLKRLYPYMPRLQAQSPEYLQKFFRVAEGDLADQMFSHLPRWQMSSRNQIFFSDEVRNALRDHDPVLAVRELAESADQGWDPFSRAQSVEAETLLPGYILSSQGDRMLMAHGVEGRHPFLDHRVAELVARLPARLKMRVLEEKYILKRACGDLVPTSVLRRPKQPYRAPDSASFFADGRARHEWVAELLSPGRVRRDGIFDPARVSKLADKALKGRTVSNQDNMAIVGVLSTQILIDRFIRNFKPARVEG